ncbi:hypothetical protein [Parahaliea mediterranea]|uniref:hypothetical protein n=1 Tax=Parahaliea mediterranea TaxID=651086 RepID=UPI0013006053|nr:hypothetical protein [Parahaliea mediterranea]
MEPVFDRAAPRKGTPLNPGGRRSLLRRLFQRLLPAAIATSVFAALAHAVLVGIAARSIGLELAYIGSLSFFVALVVAVPGGAVLLAVVAAFKLKPLSSLLLFLVVIQGVAIGVEMLLFENSIADTSWQYGLISVPAAVVAWYRSVYEVHKRTEGAGA